MTVVVQRFFPRRPASRSGSSRSPSLSTSTSRNVASCLSTLSSRCVSYVSMILPLVSRLSLRCRPSALLSTQLLCQAAHTSDLICRFRLKSSRPTSTTSAFLSNIARPLLLMKLTVLRVTASPACSPPTRTRPTAGRRAPSASASDLGRSDAFRFSALSIFFRAY